MASPSPLFATLHQLVDAARFHSEQQAIDAHDSIDAHVAGKSLEDFRKEREAASPAAQANEDAILAKAADIQKQRDAQKAAAADQQAQIDAAAQAQRPATPVAVAVADETPATSDL